ATRPRAPSLSIRVRHSLQGSKAGPEEGSRTCWFPARQATAPVPASVATPSPRSNVRRESIGSPGLEGETREDGRDCSADLLARAVPVPEPPADIDEHRRRVEEAASSPVEGVRGHRPKP